MTPFPQTGTPAKLAVSVTGLFIVTLMGLLAPLTQPVPEQVQLEKLLPELAVANNPTALPEAYHPLDVLTLPPPEIETVK
jgi:hypothetical protein